MIIALDANILVALFWLVPDKRIERIFENENQ